MNNKVIRYSSISKSSDLQLLEGFSLCYGHFNAIHPGHLRYFRRAKSSGAKLLVALEGDSQLSEPDFGYLYSEVDRAQALAALDVVNRVVILDTGRLQDFVKLASPAFLFLGKEYETTRAADVVDAVERVHSLGGAVVYDPGETHYATSDFLHTNQNELEIERWKQFREALSKQNVDLDLVVRKTVGNVGPRLLIVGDTIVDQYVACDPVGMSNEAPVIVVKELEARNYLGGAAIVAAHVAALQAQATFLSVNGGDENAEFVESTLKDLGVKTQFIEDQSRPTTFKIRYMVENQKLFRVSRLKEHSISKEKEELAIKIIRERAKEVDSILVCDFVYGMITSRIVDVIHEVSQEHDVKLFGDLQCSSQVGSVTKFKQFTLLCPTEKEVRIALRNQDDGVEYIANLLINETQTENLVITLGADGLIAYMQGADGNIVRRQHFPALSVNPVDVTGAGDSLLAAVSVAMTLGMNLMEACALACCVSALTVQTVGNTPISIDVLKQFIERRFH
jgi:rfaE bifunctional protein kinase chain/domain